jgi:hypothetical protein
MPEKAPPPHKVNSFTLGLIKQEVVLISSKPLKEIARNG